MTETWKMYIWMAIALIDTYIIIKDEFKRGTKNVRSKSRRRTGKSN